MLACRLLDLASSCGAAIDLLIGLKFSPYLVPHPNKRLWLVHRHRTAYNLWEHEICDLIRYSDGPAGWCAIHDADRTALAEARAVFTCRFRAWAALRHLEADRLPAVRALARKHHRRLTANMASTFRLACITPAAIKKRIEFVLAASVARPLRTWRGYAAEVWDALLARA